LQAFEKKNLLFKKKNVINTLVRTEYKKVKLQSEEVFFVILKELTAKKF
jgi:hypothetical protein